MKTITGVIEKDGQVLPFHLVIHNSSNLALCINGSRVWNSDSESNLLRNYGNRYWVSLVHYRYYHDHKSFSSAVAECERATARAVLRRQMAKRVPVSPILLSAKLWYRNSWENSDKVYNITVIAYSDGKYETVVEYGKRTAPHLIRLVKYSGYNRNTAIQEYDKLSFEKLNKGYKHSY